uniref:Uncharacterized protein n=1 Tax=Manihot esculenta TaxID=3983 RepID=A0A2C9VHC9_MANES
MCCYVQAMNGKLFWCYPTGTCVKCAKFNISGNQVLMFPP